jgi:hypothetical protein
MNAPVQTEAMSAPAPAALTSQRVDVGQRLEIGERDSLMRMNLRFRRADLDRIARFRERLQRSGEVEDLDLGQHDEDYAANTSSTFAIRAKRPRKTASVRSMIASVDNVPIGNVSVASVTKSTS